MGIVLQGTRTIMSGFTRLLIVAIGVWTLAPVAARGQSLAPGVPEGLLVPDVVVASGDAAAVDQPAGPIPTPEHTGFKAFALDLFEDVKHLPATENLWWAAGGGAGALAVHPADKHVTPYFVNAPWAHGVFVFGAYLGDTPELLAISGTVYFVGRWQGNKKVSHLGMDLIQALAVSNALVQPLKFATRRERPDNSGATSFPSGHASDTFAVATALERHLGWKGAVPGYMFASYVAISRLHDNRHFLSDVVFGSTVGIISGRTVTRHGREFPVAVIMYQRRSP
jgi:membrane-associated phospholipid phosphatase